MELSLGNRDVSLAAGIFYSYSKLSGVENVHELRSGDQEIAAGFGVTRVGLSTRNATREFRQVVSDCLAPQRSSDSQVGRLAGR